MDEKMIKGTFMSFLLDAIVFKFSGRDCVPMCVQIYVHACMSSCMCSCEENVKSYCLSNFLRAIFPFMGSGWGRGQDYGRKVLYEFRTFHYSHPSYSHFRRVRNNHSQTVPFCKKGRKAETELINLRYADTRHVSCFSGNHRPLWPKYGEYIYLPPQRWVHSIEVTV